MIALISLFIVLTLSLIVTRIGTTMLVTTGMSKESAKFQARSAFTGVGFTTKEAETVMQHPVRRKIIMALMLAGNLGIASAVSSLIISFIDTKNSQHWWMNVIMMVGGGALMLYITLSKTIEIWFNKRIYSTIKKYTHLSVTDYISLLQLEKGYAVAEMLIKDNDWVAGKTILEAALSREGILILGIQKKDGRYIGAPRPSTILEPGDVLLLYSTLDKITKLDQRRRGLEGNIDREEAIRKHREWLKKVYKEEDKDNNSVDNNNK